MINEILFTLPNSTQMIWVWLTVCVVCIIIETQTTDLVSMYFGLGAFVSIFLAILDFNFWTQLWTCAIISTVTLLLTRPIALKYMKVNEIKTNVDSFVGKIGTVTKEILPNERGEVKINGILWLALSNDNTKIENDSLVEILAIEGNKLIVKENKGE